MARAIHNVDRSRTPVLIYAGASPFSSEGEYKGTRNECVVTRYVYSYDTNLDRIFHEQFSFLLHTDIPDQTAIVRQYMQFTGQISSSATVSQSIKRALQM